MNDEVNLSLSMAAIYAFIKSWLPKKDLGLFEDMVQNRLSTNYGTSEFCITKMDKHYRLMAEKYLEIVDDCMEKAGELEYAEQDH